MHKPAQGPVGVAVRIARRAASSLSCSTVCGVHGGDLADRDEVVAESRRPPLRLLIAVAGALVSVAAYVILENALHSEAYALAITESAGVVWLLAVGLRQGRLNPFAAATAVVLVVALVITVASGGSALPLKLRRGAITGPLGLACLVSVAIGRPLLPALLDLLASGSPQPAAGRLRSLRQAVPAPKATWLTLIVGLTLTADAVVQVTLALTVSTTAFVGLTRLARIAISGVGLTACGIYWRGARAEGAEQGEGEMAPAGRARGGDGARPERGRPEHGGRWERG